MIEDWIKLESNKTKKEHDCLRACLHFIQKQRKQWYGQIIWPILPLILCWFFYDGNTKPALSVVAHNNLRVRNIWCCEFNKTCFDYQTKNESVPAECFATMQCADRWQAYLTMMARKDQEEDSKYKPVKRLSLVERIFRLCEKTLDAHEHNWEIDVFFRKYSWEIGLILMLLGVVCEVLFGKDHWITTIMKNLLQEAFNSRSRGWLGMLGFSGTTPPPRSLTDPSASEGNGGRDGGNGLLISNGDGASSEESAKKPKKKEIPKRACEICKKDIPLPVGNKKVCGEACKKIKADQQKAKNKKTPKANAHAEEASAQRDKRKANEKPEGEPEAKRMDDTDRMDP